MLQKQSISNDSEKRANQHFYFDTSAKHQEGIKHCIQWIELQKRMHSQTNININLSHKVGNIPACLLAISLTATFLHIGGMQMTAAFPIPVFYRGKHLYSWRYKVISPQQMCIWRRLEIDGCNHVVCTPTLSEIKVQRLSLGWYPFQKVQVCT